MQTQYNSASDTYVGAHDVASAVLDQSTNHNDTTDVKDNYNSRLFDTPSDV